MAAKPRQKQLDERGERERLSTTRYEASRGACGVSLETRQPAPADRRQQQFVDEKLREILDVLEASSPLEGS